MIFKTIYKADEKYALKSNHPSQIHSVLSPSNKFNERNLDKDKFMSELIK